MKRPFQGIWWMLLVGIGWWVIPSSEASMVCLEKSTGKLLEYQSNALPGVLTRNALSAGYQASEIEEHTVTEAQWQVIKDQWVDAPARAQKQQREEAKQVKAEKLRQKLGLSKAEFDELREALQ